VNVPATWEHSRVHVPRWTSPLRHLREAAASVAPVLPVAVARVAVASGIGVLADAGWGLVAAGLLVATWPRRAAR
jgi:hypothetical protein